MIEIKEVNNFIDEAPEGQQELLHELRTMIAEAFPDCTEQYKWSRPVYGLAKDFCYLAKFKKHVTLGFYNPTKIDDPENLLEGTGKVLQHIKLRSMDDLKIDLFKKMLSQAAERNF